ncbi:MAG: hypothetical protein V9F82_09650 [Dermatophilaceae bacterium]
MGESTPRPDQGRRPASLPPAAPGPRGRGRGQLGRAEHPAGDQRVAEHDEVHQGQQGRAVEEGLHR